ncbi:MAG: hypothetical protein JXR19_11025 [Bacteroidia bacterium]
MQNLNGLNGSYLSMLKLIKPTRLILIFLVGFFGSHARAQSDIVENSKGNSSCDRIILENGNVIEAHILEEDSTGVSYKECYSDEAEVQFLPSSSIKKVKIFHKATNSIYVTGNLSVYAALMVNAEFKLFESSFASLPLNHFLRLSLGRFEEIIEGGYDGLGVAYTIVEGHGNHHFDFSAGVAIPIRDYNDSNLFPEFDDYIYPFPILDLGYRYQKPGGGAVFKFYAANLGLGVGFGWAF